MITLGILLGTYNVLSFDSLKYFNLNYWIENQKLSGFSEIATTDQLSAFPTTYNANLLKTIEVGTTSVPTITTLSGLTSASALVTVGNITAGRWAGNTIQSANGGTGTTTMSQYRVLLGNGTASTTVATSTGTAGQFFKSNGEGKFPSWQSDSVDITANFAWTGLHSFSQPVNASSTLQIAGQTSIASSSPMLGRNLTVSGGAMISGTTTVSKLVIASSTAEINGLGVTWPSSNTAPPAGFTASSTAFNNGFGVIAWGLAEDIGASTTNTNWIGNGTYQHSLGRIPKFIRIYAVTTCDIAGTQEFCQSTGMSTTTSTNFGGSAKTVFNSLRVAATTAYGLGTDLSDIIHLEDSGSGVDAAATLSAWDSTTFTLNWATNVNAGSIRRLNWEIR